MELLYTLLIILVVTRAFGEVAVRIGQPALVGELVAGIILGVVAREFSSFMPVLANLPRSEVFKALSDLGVFFLMLLAGLEMRPREIAKASSSALAVAVGGMVVPLLAGVGLGWLVLPPSEFRVAQMLFLGTALAITAVPAAVKVLMDVGKLDSKPGRIIVSAAIFDDILSLVLLALLTSLLNTGHWPGASGLVTIAARIAVFFAITVAFGLYLLPLIGKRLRHAQLDEFEFSILLIVALAFAVLAEHLHIHFILGAFAAGLFFTRRTVDRKETFERAKSRVSGLTVGFLAPVFFASIGIHLDVSALGAVPGFLLLLIAVAVVSKFLGAGIAASVRGLSRVDALVVGVGMSSRGAVELIIADIAFRAGLFAHPDPPPPIVANLFSAVVIMAVVTTLLAPLGLRAVLSRFSRGA